MAPLILFAGEGDASLCQCTCVLCCSIRSGCQMEWPRNFVSDERAI